MSLVSTHLNAKICLVVCVIPGLLAFLQEDVYIAHCDCFQSQTCSAS